MFDLRATAVLLGSLIGCAERENPESVELLRIQDIVSSAEQNMGECPSRKSSTDAFGTTVSSSCSFGADERNNVTVTWDHYAPDAHLHSFFHAKCQDHSFQISGDHGLKIDIRSNPNNVKRFWSLAGPAYPFVSYEKLSDPLKQSLDSFCTAWNAQWDANRIFRSF